MNIIKNALISTGFLYTTAVTIFSVFSLRNKNTALRKADLISKDMDALLTLQLKSIEYKNQFSLGDEAINEKLFNCIDEKVCANRVGQNDQYMFNWAELDNARVHSLLESALINKANPYSEFNGVNIIEYAKDENLCGHILIKRTIDLANNSTNYSNSSEIVSGNESEYYYSCEQPLHDLIMSIYNTTILHEEM